MNNLIKMTIRLNETTNTGLESYAKEKALEKASCARMLIKERLSEIQEEKSKKVGKKEQKYIQRQKRELEGAPIARKAPSSFHEESNAII